jgi:DNA-binding transcriptional regulator YhcF (GntR family)
MTGDSPRITRPDSIHQQVARQLRNDIAAGVLRHGQPLPSTRELAEDWKVSVYTINEAMRLLADEGLVVSKPRAGRVVNAPEQSSRTEVRAANPHVILVGGYAGSGKTELGRVIARQTGWPILDKDTLTRPVVEVALELLGLSPNDRESAGYLEKVRPREYESLIETTIENVQCGNSAVVTAPLIRELNDKGWVDRVTSALDAYNARLSVVWVYCDMETMYTYVRRRGAARDASKLDNWAKYAGTVNTEFRPVVSHHVIDNGENGEPLKTQADRLLTKILDGRR